MLSFHALSFHFFRAKKNTSLSKMRVLRAFRQSMLHALEAFHHNEIPFLIQYFFTSIAVSSFFYRKFFLSLRLNPLSNDEKKARIVGQIAEMLYHLITLTTLTLNSKPKVIPASLYAAITDQLSPSYHYRSQDILG